MADCLISGTLYKTVGASATEPRTSFTFYVGKGLLSGSQIAREKVAVTTDASDGTFSFAAQQGELINVTGDFVIGDYAFKDGLELFVPLSGTASFTSLKTPRDYVRALNSTVGNAPGDATFILQTADADLANAQALGALATGILKSTTSTGVLSIATAADLPLISTLTADATPDSAADYVLTYDASAGAHKKVLLSDLPGGGGGGGGTWGSITGTLSSQTDLQAALDLKAPLISPSFTTPTLGVASATSINKVALTAPATSATLTIADGKTFTASNTLTLTATDGSTLAIGTGGTLGSAAYTSASAYEVPLTFSTGLTRSVNTITVNTSQNIATLSNLTSDGLVTTSGGAGTLGVTVPGTGVLTALAVNVGSAGAFVVLNGAGGTPSSLTLTNATGLPISTGVSGLGTGVATFLATPSSANLAAAVTDETGSGALVFANSPTLVTPALGTPSSLTLTNATGLPPTTGISGWPANAAGVLTNNGSGTLSWGAAGGGITIGTTAIASGTATRLLYETAGNVVGEISGATSDGTTVTLTSPTINTGITLNAAPLTMSGNISSAAWTTSGIRIKGASVTLTDTTSSGTVAAAYTNVLGGNTIAASSSTTFTDYYTTFITQPTAGTNVTFTRRWALGLSGNLSTAGTIVQTSASATAFESGPNGSTNPVFRLVNNTASAATGLSITGNAAGSGVTLTALSSGTNESVYINPRGDAFIRTVRTTGNTGGYQVVDGSNNVLTWLYGSATNGRLHLGYNGIVASSSAAAGASNRNWEFGSTYGYFRSDFAIGWYSATTIDSGSLDTRLIRSAASTVRVSDGTTGAGSLLIGTSAGAIGTSGAGVLAMSLSTAPGSGPADTAQLWAADMQSTAGNHGFHMRNEINTAALIVPGVRYKTDTGDPTDLFEGMIVINTFDNNLKVYADGALRTVTTW